MANKGIFITANNQIAKDLEAELKDIILKEDLIDTGLLYDTITAVVREDSIYLYTQDYLKYNDEKYQVTEQLEDSKAFKNAEKRYEEVIRKRISKLTE